MSRADGSAGSTSPIAISSAGEGSGCSAPSSQTGGINARGITVFLVEQNVHQTLTIADYGYVLSKGRVVAQGTPAELAETKEVHEAYFG
jgi:hypothetical protein